MRIIRSIKLAPLLAMALLSPVFGCHGTSSTVNGNRDSAGPSDTGNRDTGKSDTWAPDAILVTDASAQPADAGGFPANSTKPLTQLTTAEQQLLCDQVDANQGGYGRVVRCSDGSTQTTDTSQGSCVAGIPALATLCPALTAGDVVGCSLATGTDLCLYPTAPGCAALYKCLG